MISDIEVAASQIVIDAAWLNSLSTDLANVNVMAVFQGLAKIESVLTSLGSIADSLQKALAKADAFLPAPPPAPPGGNGRTVQPGAAE